MNRDDYMVRDERTSPKCWIKKRISWKWVAVITVAVLCLGILDMIFSPISELRKNAIMGRQQTILRENMEAYTELARTLLEDSPEDVPDTYYRWNRAQMENEDLCLDVKALSEKTGAELYGASVHGQGSFQWSAGDCVFTYELWGSRGCSREIYCWVDMVYNENMAERLQTENMKAAITSGLVIPVNDCWCILVRYGY